MPAQKRKFSNPLEQAMQTGIIGYIPETEAPGEAEQDTEALGTQGIKKLGTQVPENLIPQEIRNSGTQGIVYTGTQEIENSGTQGTKKLGTQGIESKNAKSSSGEYSRLGVYILTDLHRRLKAHAALQGREISDIAAQAFLEYLARNENERRG